MEKEITDIEERKKSVDEGKSTEATKIQKIIISVTSPSFYQPFCSVGKR